MANFAASAVQLSGQALVRTASTLAINQATNYISRAFDRRNFEGPRLESFHLQTSRDGAPMARVFGRVRLAGQVIWASHIREITTEMPVGGKGSGPQQTDFSYRISFAIGLCEGEIAGVDRIWANGAPLEVAGLDMRVYRGTDTQMADPIITATEGPDAPGFRGTAYLVFEDFPLGAFGNRLPQLNIEVMRTGRRIGRLENLIQSVNLLPGSGEFAYATEIVEESPRPGETRPLNMNNLSGKADIELALDQLQAQLPNCRNISIISSWFGSSVDIADCDIRPGVEGRQRNIRNANWQVGQVDRSSAYIVSEDEENRPNFGGTPSDESLIQAIRSIRARGMSVTLYPFILVDAPGFPWRGRITGQAIDIESFFNAAHGFRQFVLSHAELAKRAGGVDRFVIGSEMVGLTTIRDAENHFPAVTELARLAGDVGTILEANTGLTYAADWSEYFGYHPQDGSGDVFFHLDELWAHPAITAIGIDAYFPLSDWRAGEHVDGQFYDSLYEPDYLIENIEGGEGYDWFYASQSDRDTQNRTPISEWIYRYKDIRSWWQNEHRNRIGGVEQPSTSWVPESKSFWLTEVGCPAVHLGSNQPNLFSDGKSDESNIPYYSVDYRDDLIQRRYLEALIGYWSVAENNPLSNVTGTPMIDMSATSVWAWDARPYPDFPARDHIWSDGQNWQTGHWINGRVGAVSLQDVIEDICAEAGLNNPEVLGVTGLVSGFLIDRPMRARDALSPLMEAYDLTLSEQAGQVSFSTRSSMSVTEISAAQLIDQEGGAIQYMIDDNMTSLRDVRLTYIDAARDYQTATVAARNELAETVRVIDLNAPIVMDQIQARNIVERALEFSETSRRKASLALPPQTALTAGEIVTIPQIEGETEGGIEGLWQIDNISLGFQADVSLSAVPSRRSDLVITSGEPRVVSDPIWISEAVALAFDLPGREGVQVGVLQNPFRAGTISFAESSIPTSVPVKIGALLTPLSFRPPTIWDRVSEIDIYIPEGVWFAISEAKALAGGNRFAVETETGWEIIGAADVALIGEQTYRLKTLLRGLNNSDDLMMPLIPSGARIVALDAGLVDVPIDEDFIGQSLELEVVAGGRAGIAAQIDYKAAHLRPLSVVHVKARGIDEETELSWIPRNLDNSEAVDLNMQVEIRWPDGVITAAGNIIRLPISYGSGTSVTLTPIHPIGGNGLPKRIVV